MKTLLLFLLFPCMHVFAQPAVYTTANAHSHNDYQQPAPFYSAYNLQYGSIEVDVILSENELYVAHTMKDVAQNRLFENLYLSPLADIIQKNAGNVYADTSRKLMLMLDIKAEAVPSINKLIELLMKYPAVTRCPSLIILITGSKPPQSTYSSYPSFLWFDGLLSTNYSKQALSRIALLGENFINYSQWNGHEDLLANDWEKLKKAVDKGHALGKKIRFWNTPDFIEGWQKLIELGIDYINTDSIKALAEYLKTNGVRKS
ncbi:alkaline phosphatase [Niastella caeni]|uniref:Alkaline phosphatase n=1 Tax=Niastella caeni TaxID=2569763 RepID=A0A4S8HIR8_9BACT|nr:alkaline phosphatase [Niastella caeni]THU34925.1 alkaline phosphatase [Niastella caeni]